MGGKVGVGPEVPLSVGVLRGVRVGRRVRVGGGVHEGTGVVVAGRVGVREGSDMTMAWVGVGLSMSGSPRKREGETKATR